VPALRLNFTFLNKFAREQTRYDIDGDALRSRSHLPGNRSQPFEALEFRRFVDSEKLLARDLGSVGRPANGGRDAATFCRGRVVDIAKQSGSNRKAKTAFVAGREDAIDQRHFALAELRIRLLNFFENERLYFFVELSGISLRGPQIIAALLKGSCFVSQPAIINHAEPP